MKTTEKREKIKEQFILIIDIILVCFNTSHPQKMHQQRTPVSYLLGYSDLYYYYYYYPCFSPFDGSDVAVDLPNGPPS